MDIEKEIASKYYRFAKTMPTIPHSYSRRSEWKDDKLFKQFGSFMGSLEGYDCGKNERFIRCRRAQIMCAFENSKVSC